MNPVATPREMRDMDRETVERYGVPAGTLMERAAEALADAVGELLPAGGRVLALCGGGNNGGDGLAAARLLHGRGYAVEAVLLADPRELRGDAAENLRRLPIPYTREPAEGGRPELILDALLGTGLSRDVTGEMAAAVAWVRKKGVPVVSADIPSGVDGLTGAVRGAAVRGAAVRARVTVTFGCPKRGCLLYPGREYAGTLRVADIGIPGEILQKASGRSWEAADVGQWLPPRPADSHKGRYGHVAVVAGSEGMTGAGALCSAAAMRAGAGLCTWIHPRGAAVQPAWEVMTRPAGGREGAFCEDSLPEILPLLAGKSALAMGPGLGRRAETAAVVRRVLAETDQPLVLDADGVTVMAGEYEILRRRKKLCLTPHPGEMSALTGAPVEAITADPAACALEMAARLEAVVLLKGASTVIAATGGRLAVNTTGNAGMATGGSGDVLTGMIAGLAAQGVGLFEAAVMGAWLHGLAGDRAAEQLGPWSMTASDLLGHIPDSFLEAMKEARR